MPQRTPDGKWVIWERATGRRLECWPVDARPRLATGFFVNAEPASAAEAETPGEPAAAPKPRKPRKPSAVSPPE